MTLLELAHYKGMTIQAVCQEVKRVTGYELPCTRNVNVVDSIIEKVAPTYFNRKANIEAENTYERRKEKKNKKKKVQIIREYKTHKEIDFLTSDEDEIIATVLEEMSNCVILDFLTGGTLTLQKSKFGKKPNINKGDIVGLEFIDSPDYLTEERFRVCYILPKVQWQKAKIKKAYNEKKIISGRVLYPYKDHGVFVNIYGIQALMFNNQISDDAQLYEGAKINVAISSVEIEESKFRVSVSQKWAESLSKQKEKKEYARAIKDDYLSIHEGECLDTVIDRIDENYIIVKYGNLSGIIYRSDLFWCNVKNINDHLEEGNPIRAGVVSKEIKEDGKFNVRLSHKEFSLNPWESTVFNEQGEASGPITAVYDRFIIIKIAEGVEGVLHANDMTRMEFEALKSWTYDDGDVNVIIKSIDKDNKRIELCTPALEEIDEIWNNIHLYYEVDKSYKGNVISYEDNQLWVQLEEGIEASINKNEMSWTNSSLIIPETFSFGTPINVFITHIDKSKRKIIASVKRLTPNPWATAEASISVGSTCIVKVIDRKEKVLIVETQDSFHLIGRIKLSEISWFPLKPNEEPQIGWKLEAKVMVFQPEKYVLKLSARQLQEDPWNSLYIGAEVNGTIQTRTDSAFINVQLENKLLAKTSELEFLSQIGKIYPFKVVSCNRATQEIIVSHKSLVFDQKTEEIVKSFFNVQ